MESQKNIGITKKYVGIDLDANQRNEPLGGALYGDVDGPRYRDGQSTAQTQEWIHLCTLSNVLSAMLEL